MLRFITDRGQIAHVLLSIEEYQKLTERHRNIADALAMPGAEDIEFNPPRAKIRIQPSGSPVAPTTSWSRYRPGPTYAESPARSALESLETLRHAVPGERPSLASFPACRT